MAKKKLNSKTASIVLITLTYMVDMDQHLMDLSIKQLFAMTAWINSFKEVKFK